MSAGHNWSDRNGSPAVELLHNIGARRDQDADEVGEGGLPYSQIKFVHEVGDEEPEVVDSVRQ